jgi:hypothetical protein
LNLPFGNKNPSIGGHPEPKTPQDARQCWSFNVEKVKWALKRAPIFRLLRERFV